MFKNVHVAANEYQGELILHKVKDSAVDDSYGIQVAKLADLPNEVIDRAQVILNAFEQNLRINSLMRILTINKRFRRITILVEQKKSNQL